MKLRLGERMVGRGAFVERRHRGPGTNGFTHGTHSLGTTALAGKSAGTTEQRHRICKQTTRKVLSKALHIGTSLKFKLGGKYFNFLKFKLGGKYFNFFIQVSTCW